MLRLSLCPCLNPGITPGLTRFTCLAQAVGGGSSGSPVTPRGTSSLRSLVGRVRGVDPPDMQSPNKTKYSRSESCGAGVRVADHPVGQHTYPLLPPTPLPFFLCATAEGKLGLTMSRRRSARKGEKAYTIMVEHRAFLPFLADLLQQQ